MRKSAAIIFMALLPLLGLCRQRTVKPQGAVITQARDAGRFTAVEVSSVIRLTITQSKDFSIHVETHESILPYVETYVKGGLLHIGIKEGVRIEGKEIMISASVAAPLLTRIKASGASSVATTGMHADIPLLAINLSGASTLSSSFSCDAIMLKASGASKCNADITTKEDISATLSGASFWNAKVSCDRLKIDCSGASGANLAGNCGECSVKASGTSVIRCPKLIYRSLEGTFSGASTGEFLRIGNPSLSTDGTSKTTLRNP